jgi:uncharacterized C2H2 Zn-finger protein
VTAFDAAIRAVTDPSAESLRCPDCAAEYLEDCDLSKHAATDKSFARYLNRARKIHTIKYLALGATS